MWIGSIWILSLWILPRWSHNLLLILLISPLIMVEGRARVAASTTLYNQTLFTFSTHINDEDDPRPQPKYYVWTLDLRNPQQYNDKPTTMTEMTFPDLIMADVFTFTNSTRYPTVLAFSQTGKEELLEKNMTTSTFYSYQSNLWSPTPTLAANGPVRRTAASFVPHQNRMVVYGGFITAPNFYNRLLTRQLYSYDDDTQQWSDLTQTAVAADIPPCAFHSATLIQDRYMVILGGSIALSTPDGHGIGMELDDNNSQFRKRDLETAYIFDLKTNTWSTKDTINFSPLPRIGHTANFIPQQNAIVVVGGTNKFKGGDLYKDLQLLDLATWTWHEIQLRNPRGVPTLLPCAWHGSYLLETQLFIMFQGDREVLSYRTINTYDWSYTDQIEAAPLTSRRTPKKALLSFMEPPTAPPNTKLILGSTIGALGGGVVSLILVFLYLKFIRWWREYRTEKRQRADLIKFPFLLTPLWSPTRDLPITSDVTWDLDSMYANSTHLLIAPSTTLPLHYHPTTTSHPPSRRHHRRWSADFTDRTLLSHPHALSPKLKSEIRISFISSTSSSPRHTLSSTTTTCSPSPDLTLV